MIFTTTNRHGCASVFVLKSCRPIRGKVFSIEATRKEVKQYEMQQAK